MAQKNSKQASFLLRGLFAVLFFSLIIFGVFKLVDINAAYVEEAAISEEMAVYKPPEVDLDNLVIPEQSENTDAAGLTVINETIVDAQHINPDVVGWVTMDGTKIDYAFTIAEDNDYYLRRDIHQKNAYAGTPFMDFRDSRDFSSFLSKIYGHSMKNGTVFTGIKKYAKSDFFEANTTGWLFLPCETYKLEVFAFMNVRSDDNMVYGTDFGSDFERQRLLLYIEENASQFRQLSLRPDDRLLVLSTCAYNYDEARSVVISRLVKVE